MKTSNKLLMALIVTVLILAGIVISISLNLHKSSRSIIKGNGHNETIVKNIDAFSSLDITGPFEVNVKLGEKNNIELSGDSNILPYIKFEKTKNKLYIYPKRSITTKTPLKLQINTDNIDSIDLWGTKPAYIRNINNDEFKISVNGKGSLYAKGQTKKLKIVCNGEGYIDTGNLKSESVRVELFGDGNIRTSAEKSLDIEISGAGAFTGYGETQKLIVNCSGAGNIDTRKLKAVDANITLNGASKAKVYVEGDLKVNITGLGKVIYYGNPNKVQQNIIGLGKLIDGNKEKYEK
jgi:hypothetical protein